ncbi:PPM-type phosphatase domain-containing protein [Sulfidibacter corallicola]|uniref:PPM-type phosphatase domain-containing protein n=1 Tax=Sulfidibacter corallicola TaxID=2818388 RepID=A0A8A4TLT2_SULCO|nr:hypothetical protein [Sulfidibacter corallicola]QTD47565.1 hypothetical protein J3U87_18390 [Sulfidibacter corallicola]
MRKTPIQIPTLSAEDFAKILPPSMNYPSLTELFGHYSPIYLKHIASKMNSYTWFRFVETESKNLIFKRMATRILYRMMDRQPSDSFCAGNENGYVLGERAEGLSSRGVNYKAVNEDGIGVFERENELLLVGCDGVGDCLVGEVASYVILSQFEKHPEKSIQEVFADSVEVLLDLGDKLEGEVPEFVTFPNEISQAAVTAVSIKNNQCEIGQVGDVLLYHIRDEDLRLLDQNRQWLDLDQLKKQFSDEQYLAQRHIISNAIGRNYDPYWMPTFLTLKKGDALILASDGLETLHPCDIKDVVDSTNDDRALLNALYNRCIEANLKWNTTGSPLYTKPDNISILFYRHG